MTPQPKDQFDKLAKRIGIKLNSACTGERARRHGYSRPDLERPRFDCVHCRIEIITSALRRVDKAAEKRGYDKGYSAGHEDCMKLRVQDELDRRRKP